MYCCIYNNFKCFGPIIKIENDSNINFAVKRQAEHTELEDGL